MGLNLPKKHAVRFSGDQDLVLDFQSSLQNRTIRVVTIVDPPFVMLKNPSAHQRENLTMQDLEGNRYFMLNVSLPADIIAHYFPLISLRRSFCVTKSTLCSLE